MNKEEAIKFVTRNIPLLIQGKNRPMNPFVSLKAYEQTIECLAEALVKRNIVLDDVIKCNHDFKHTTMDGEFDGNKCANCGEYEDLT
tara:strand:+ start:462 stop:722 length:261 start_codon:yes stop_codon:yes gene_type:complete